MSLSPGPRLRDAGSGFWVSALRLFISAPLFFSAASEFRSPASMEKAARPHLGGAASGLYVSAPLLFSAASIWRSPASMRKAAKPHLGRPASRFWGRRPVSGSSAACLRARRGRQGRASRLRAWRRRQGGLGLGSPAPCAEPRPGRPGLPRAARSGLTARCRRAALDAVITRTQGPLRLRRLRTEPQPTLPLSASCFVGGF